MKSLPYPNFKLSDENTVSDVELIQDMANKYFTVSCQEDDLRVFKADIDRICDKIRG